MPNKFRKRSLERKGVKKKQEKEMKLLEENSGTLTNREELFKEYEENIAPAEEEVTESKLIPEESV